MMDINLTDSFIQDLICFSQREFSVEVNNEVDKCLVDYFGVTLAGIVEGAGRFEKIFELYGKPEGNCAVVGTSIKTIPSLAALINGIHGHTVELDDGERYAMMHPGVVVIPALLSAYTAFDLDYSSFRKGVICGYEACIRISAALQPGLKDKGFHATGVVGSMGATLGILLALGSTEEVLKSGLASAATSASGILRVIKDVSKLKPFNAGKAASNGIESAFVALSGFIGPNEVLGGDLGFMNMFSNESKLGFLKIKSDDEPKILGIYRKPYAACRHAHPAIEAALIIREKRNVSFSDIKEVLVSTYFWAVGSHDHIFIEGINSAKMSTPYAVAAAFFYGSANLSEFTLEKINNDEVLNLTAKVKIIEDPLKTGLVPKERGATVRVITYSGEEFDYTINLPKGEPECPLSLEEIEIKYHQLASYAGYSDNDIKKSLKLLYSHNIKNLLNHISLAK